MKKSIMRMSAIGVFVSLLVLNSAWSQDVTAAGTYNDGLALLKSKDYEAGLAKMEEAFELATTEGNEQVVELAAKNGSIAAYNMGNSNLKSKSYDDAINYYQKGIEMNPDYSSNYEGVARALEGKGDKTAAITAYMDAAKKALEAEEDSDKADKRFKKAEVMVGKTYVGKKYDKAIEMAQAYIASKDDTPEVYYYLSRSLAASDRNDEAIDGMKKAIELSGEEVPDKYTFYLAEQLENAGQNADAAALYRKVTEDKYKAQAEYRAGQLEG